MMQTLIHHPLGFFVVFLVLVALTLALDRLGLLVWMAWLNRRSVTRKDHGSKEYWGVHE